MDVMPRSFRCHAEEGHSPDVGISAEIITNTMLAKYKKETKNDRQQRHRPN